ncbi:uncharacterized protein BO97DRAFT_274201 [Aspergillus homomorphus CBS 101889]|uniref:Uncharacterized protein n=1 Tax=Aspergillus homomorphus (strain CBS 101889) TaxID=1450537 RepID=A0A395I4G3_ASPHC|nr:hypothetical protein BO97DRAFT_274201 [Aspergillus homomorphus CBS 101889]RAL14629.1 hypothetical protein BO97DRAFT_274201 [Aspergillus homomorphus CBS 101889]
MHYWENRFGSTTPFLRHAEVVKCSPSPGCYLAQQLRSGSCSYSWSNLSSFGYCRVTFTWFLDLYSIARPVDPELYPLTASPSLLILLHLSSDREIPSEIRFPHFPASSGFHSDPNHCAFTKRAIVAQSIRLILGNFQSRRKIK